MFEALWVIVALPLAAFLAIVLGGGKLPRRLQSLLGVAPVGAAAAIALTLGLTFLGSPPPGNSFSQHLWTWISVGSFTAEIGLYLDPLSVVMTIVITAVSFLILLYSTWFMGRDEGYGRFFAYMNLFVGSMLLLVLADNLLLLYLGWEGVGLCSYLLIGFWYHDAANVRAARKAFLVTRIGDTALAIGIFWLLTDLGTLAIHGQGGILSQALAKWGPAPAALATVPALLLLAGAIGKSAQLPLQVWLPDAMAGPTPVSALIHAATMVTAGVYLIARMFPVFDMAPEVRMLVAVIGAVTLLYASCSALVQRDIKRVLAYSTISQVGYMFLGLGVGAYSASIFHFATHACFKSLLFLGAGVVILAMKGQHHLDKMGGLRKELPLTFWTFLIAAASLSALPLVTAGFYSKDMILTAAWSSGDEGTKLLWAAGVVGALLTAVYSFRMVFLMFFGQLQEAPARRPSLAAAIPLTILAALSMFAGLLEVPKWMGGKAILSDFLGGTFSRYAASAPAAVEIPLAGELTLTGVSAAAAIAGVVLAYLFFSRKPGLAASPASSVGGSLLRRWWLAGWGFDWVYDRLLVRPFVWIATVNRTDFIEGFYNALAHGSVLLHRIFSRTENGLVRWYAAGIGIGAIVILAIVVLS